MFQGFSQEGLEFLLGIRMNNNKEWFEPRKKIYLEKVYNPMKELSEELFKPFEKTQMIHKNCRIYRDAGFPPFLHYRDTMWIDIRYPSLYWSRTPGLYFELSPEGAEIGFSIYRPEAAVMERFRNKLTENPEDFIKLVKRLKRKKIVFAGDEYKRKKPCPVPELDSFFQKKGLSAFADISDPEILFSREIAEYSVKLLKSLQPLNEYFHEIVEETEAEKTVLKAGTEIQKEEVKAPQQEFMW